MNHRKYQRKDRTHEMMLDPLTSNARVYVGNLGFDKVSKKDIEDRFKKHGRILGVSLNNGFGFVQFDKESSASAAIKHENGTLFEGKKLEVNCARRYKDNKSSMKNEAYRDRSPIDDRPVSSSKWRRDFSTERDNDFWIDNASYRSSGGGSVSDERMVSTPRLIHKNDFPPRDPSMERTNDCEIIVVRKDQRKYAEYIEHRLMQLSLTVDLLFPNEDVPLGCVLANICSHGTLYAIVIMPMNEEHLSLTLNILHGTPQEHRNMPLEDAVELIKRDYDAYIRRDKSGQLPIAVPVVPADPGAVSRNTGHHPEAVQVLLNMLASNCQLTVLQYDSVIRYLQEKRETQLKIEIGDANTKIPLANASVATQQTELQHRILNILNNNTSTMAPTPVPAPKPTASSKDWSSPTPLLSDPAVQKALDSLLQGNVIRKLAVNSAGSTAAMNGNQRSSFPSGNCGITKKR